MIKCNFNCFECAFDDCQLSDSQAELLARYEKKGYNIEQIHEKFKELVALKIKKPINRQINKKIPS